ncbi:uncharacterized protein V6R79_015709 [Siganus canaliculatus]
MITLTMDGSAVSLLSGISSLVDSRSLSHFRIWPCFSFYGYTLVALFASVRILPVHKSLAASKRTFSVCVTECGLCQQQEMVTDVSE